MPSTDSGSGTRAHVGVPSSQKTKIPFTSLGWPSHCSGTCQGFPWYDAQAALSGVGFPHRGEGLATLGALISALRS